MEAHQRRRDRPERLAHPGRRRPVGRVRHRPPRRRVRPTDARRPADPRHPIHRYGATDANPIDLVRPGTLAFLLLHGDDDRVIPPAQTLALHHALLDAGADSTHYLLAGAGHGRMALNRRHARQ